MKISQGLRRREWDSNPRGRDAQRLSCHWPTVPLWDLEAVALTTQPSRRNREHDRLGLKPFPARSPRNSRETVDGQSNFGKVVFRGSRNQVNRSEERRVGKDSRM